MLEKVINNLHLAINGQFSSVEDPNLTAEDSIVYITPDGVDFYDNEGQEVIDTVPLDWRYL